MTQADREALAAQWDRWACRIAVGYWRKYRELVCLGDLCGAARLGLWKAALRFDRDLGIPFPAYARHAVRNEVQSCVRPEVARGLAMPVREAKKCYRRPVARFSDADNGGGRPIEEAILDHRRDAPDRSDLWDRIRPCLSDQEYAVLVARYRDGESYETIAARLGVRRQRAHQIAHRAIEELRGFAELDELG